MSESFHILRISLDYSHPLIWRQVRLPSESSLDNLHEVIQTVMGWTNSHLHQFEVGSIYYEPPSLIEIDPDLRVETRDSTRATLREVAGGEGDEFSYIYDFGDDWRHTVLVEKIVPGDEGKRTPRVLCLGGERNGPPEDCGGVSGFEELLQVVNDPDHEDHEEMCEWLDAHYDPEDFNLNQISQQLRHLKI